MTKPGKGKKGKGKGKLPRGGFKGKSGPGRYPKVQLVTEPIPITVTRELLEESRIRKMLEESRDIVRGLSSYQKKEIWRILGIPPDLPVRNLWEFIQNLSDEQLDEFWKLIQDPPKEEEDGTDKT